MRGRAHTAMTLCSALAVSLFSLASALAAPASPEDSTAGEIAEATPRSVNAAAFPDKLRLGEEFTLTVTIRDEKDVRYELPSDLSLGKEFDVVRTSASRTEKDGEVETRFEIHALLFDLGERSLADLTLRAAAPGGERRLVVPLPKVTGAGDLQADSKAEMHDIMPPVPLRVPRYTALYAVAGVVGAGLLALLLARWLRNRQRRVRAAPAPPPLPPHVRALKALEDLQREDLPSQSRQKEFFFRLSEILRDYLGERFGVAALDMTTEELLAALARVPTPGLDFPRFEAFCRNGDLVRFARAGATAIACKASVEEAFAFVRATTPSEQPSREARAASASPAAPSKGAAA